MRARGHYHYIGSLCIGGQKLALGMVTMASLVSTCRRYLDSHAQRLSRSRQDPPAAEDTVVGQLKIIDRFTDFARPT